MPCKHYGCTISTPTDVCFRHAGKLYEMDTSKPVVVLMPLPQLLEKAQIIFNRWIVARDKNTGCICCGKQVTEAGHFLNAGQYAALRFTEFNVNGQDHYCNCNLHGNLVMYRVGLVLKIGLKEVLALERHPRLHKYSRKELEDIISKYSPK